MEFSSKNYISNSELQEFCEDENIKRFNETCSVINVKHSCQQVTPSHQKHFLLRSDSNQHAQLYDMATIDKQIRPLRIAIT